MMTKPSNRIASPEIEQLGHLKAMSDAAMAHKYFQENPKIIENLSASIQGAYALTEGERKERDEAVQIIANARAASKKAEDDKKEAAREAERVKKEADDYSKNIISGADIYKKQAIAAIAKDQQKVIDDKDYIKAREDKLSDDLRQLERDQKTVKDGLQEMAIWKAEREKWERDYTEISAKMDSKLRKAAKG